MSFDFITACVDYSEGWSFYHKFNIL